jgi:hypothetical protein
MNMQRQVYRTPRTSARTQVPPLPKFPDFEVAKESILKLSSALEGRGSGGKPSERRKPFEEILQRATDGMLTSLRKNMPL